MTPGTGVTRAGVALEQLDPGSAPADGAELGAVCGRAARVELFEGHARSGDARAWRHAGTEFAWIEESHAAVGAETR